MTTQDQVNQTAWAACDTFRSVVDAGRYKDYILVMLFFKYISDLWDDHVARYRKRYGLQITVAISSGTGSGSGSTRESRWLLGATRCPHLHAELSSTARAAILPPY